jgi:hypothetical protein
VGAVCGNSARTDLGGGRSAMSVPTANLVEALTVDRRDNVLSIQPQYIVILSE